MLNGRSGSQAEASHQGVTRAPADVEAEALNELNRMFFGAASDSTVQPEPRQDVCSPGTDACRWLDELLTIPAEEPETARIIQLDAPPRTAAPAKDWLSELLAGP